MKQLLICLITMLVIACSQETREREIANEPKTVSSPNEEEMVLIRGKVFNYADSSAISGAIIMLIGSAIGTITDDEGNFLINVPSENPKLAIAVEGFKTEKLVMKSDSVNYIYLIPNTADNMLPND